MILDPPTLPKPITEMFGEIVTAIQAARLAELQAVDDKIEQVHYMFAPPDEVIETLVEMSQTQAHMMRKYPLIVLFEDITVREGRADAYYGTTSLNLIICTQTEATYKSWEREQKTFAPILRPLMDEFRKQIKLSPYFAHIGPLFPADVTERKRWGREGLYNQEGNLFADRIDAIEITNLELTLRPAPVAVPFKSFL